LRLLSGAKIVSTSSITFPPEFEYGDNSDFLKVFVLSYVKFLCDSPLESLTPRKSRDFMRFLKRLVTERLDVIIKEFSGYSHLILSSDYGTGGSDQYPFHECMLSTPIAREYITWYRTRRPELLKYIISFLTFGKKAEYIDEALDTTALREWFSVEERLHALEFSEIDLANLRLIVSEILAPIDDHYLLPKFGPGKVAESGVSHVYDKLSSLTSHSRLEYAFARSRKQRLLDEGFMSNLGHEIQGSDSSEVSELRFVPKDITKSRSICKEPNAFMYFQQEVLRYMRGSMDNGEISRFVNLDDQTVNQRAAVHGSTYLSSDTLDLSSASDSVHIDLVKGIFPPKHLFYMLATRTSQVRVPGHKKPVHVRKFAPMGSAVCFPTQCIVFTAVSLYAYIAVQTGTTAGEVIYNRSDVAHLLSSGLHRVRSPETPFTVRFEPPVVFGDDIICDTRVTDVVVSILTRLGFMVNVRKSFTGSQSFRESCGVFAYDGSDVTPVMFRLPMFRHGKRFDTGVYASFMENVNNMRRSGYNQVASFWLSLLKDHGFKYPLPYTEDDTGFGLFTRNKHRVPSQYLRWNANWQTNEEVQQGIGPLSVKSRVPWNHEHYRYNQWWRSRVRGGTVSPSEYSLRIRPQETRLVPRWARYEK